MMTSFSPRPRALTWLTVIAVLLFALTLFLALFAAPAESQGPVQRIFYIHMPAFFCAAAGFAVTLVGSIAYLRTRREKWDALAVAGAESGLVFGLFNVVSGMAWARPIWNTWWDWSPRLSTMTIMLLLYAAYLMLRGALETPERRARFGGVYGVLAFASVILVYLLPRITADIHPITFALNFFSGQSDFESQMSFVLAANFVSMLLLTGVLIWHRYRLEVLARSVQQRRTQILSR